MLLEDEEKGSPLSVKTKRGCNEMRRRWSGVDLYSRECFVYAFNINYSALTMAKSKREDFCLQTNVQDEKRTRNQQYEKEKHRSEKNVSRNSPVGVKVRSSYYTCSLQWVQSQQQIVYFKQRLLLRPLY